MKKVFVLMAIVSLMYGCATVTTNANRMCGTQPTVDPWNTKPCVQYSYKVLTW